MTGRCPIRHGAGMLVLGVVLLLLTPWTAGAFQQNPKIKIEGRARNVRDAGRRFVLDTGRERYDVEYPRGGPGFGYNVANMRDGDRVRVEGSLIGNRLVEARTVVLLNPSNDGNLGSGQVTGRVTDVDRSRRRFSVEPDRGSRVRVEYDSGTSVQGLDRNDPSRIRDGDIVRVEGRFAARQMLVARRIDVRNQPDGDLDWRSGDRGRIESVDRSGRRLRVRFSGATLNVDVRDAEIRGRDRRLNLDALRSGDEVRVDGERRGQTIRANRVRLLE
jgi:cytochrome c-type biogenesis protein CcmE